MSDATGPFEPATALELFAVRLARDPDAPLILTPDGVFRSYAEIGRRAERVAAALRARGVVPGEVVGLYLGNDPAWIAVVLGSWWAGCAIAACGTVSPLAEARRRFDLVNPRCVVAEDPDPFVDGWTVLAVDAEGQVAADGVDSVPEPCANPAPDDLGAIFFTSGTTGEAKATVHSHQRLIENARATARAYASSPGARPRTAAPDRPPSVSFSPFGHLAALGRLIFRMYVGRSLLIVPRFDLEVFRRLAATYPLDNLQLAPAMVHALAHAPDDIELGSLRYVTSGTAPLATATRDAFEARYGVPVLQAYGSSEGGVTARERYEDALAGHRGPGSVGRVDADTPVRILGPDGTDVAPGGDGEIVGRPDPRRSSRYLGEEGETPLPVDAEGWYHTGDIGHIDEHGILYITGRLKEMLVIGGFNVFPAEIEDALRLVPGVDDAIVVALPDDRLGEVAGAAIVWSDAPDDEADEFARLAAAVRERMAPYKVPRRWLALPAVPLNAYGKPDRAEVLRRFPVADPGRSRDRQEIR